jgi:uncharacterized protein (DUF885 family)
MKLLAVVLVLVLAASATGEGAKVEDAKLEVFFKEYLEEDFRQRPLEATRLGDHRFDDVLDDLSLKARKAWAKRLAETLAELPRRIDYKKLSRNGQIDFEIWEEEMRRLLWLGQNTRPFEDDPRVYNEYITESIYLLLTQSTLPQPRNVQNAVSRMKYIPRIVAAAKESLKSPPRVFVETAIKQNRGAIGFYQSGVYELAGETPAISELKKAAKPVIELLQEYQQWLEKELLPRASGEWRLGKDKFAEKLKLELNAGITSEEMLKEAESEAVRVEAEMYVIARQLWPTVFPKKTQLPDTEPGHRQTIAQVLEEVSKEHGKVESLVKDASAAAVKIKQFIKAKDILRLPDPDKCKIIEMPEFQRGNTIAFLNQAPAAARVERRARGKLCARIQPAHAPDIDNPRSLSGALRATGVFEQVPVADPARAFLRRFRGGLGGLHRAGDARRRLWGWRPEAAPDAVKVVPAHGVQCDPRLQNALHQHDR